MPWRRAAFALAAVVGVVVLPGRFGSSAAAGDLAVHLQHFPTAKICSYVDSWHAPRGVDAAGKPLYHEGVDIIAKTGTPILAVMDGTISRINTSTKGGNQLRLALADGTYFFHAHISRYADGLTVGEKVHAGDVIAYVGQTGDAQYSVPHLHFEVHPLGGAAVNPYPIVREVDGCDAGSTGLPKHTSTPATPTTPASTTRPTTTSPSATKPGPASTVPASTVPASTVPASTVPASTVPASTTTTRPVRGLASPNDPVAIEAPVTAGGYSPMSPVRIADSRTTFGMSRLAAGVAQQLAVGTGQVPAGALAVAVNITAVDAVTAGQLTVYPCGQAPPSTTNLSFWGRAAVANSAVVALGGGRICVVASADVDVVVDLVGWQGPAGADRYVPVTPSRLVDTRTTGNRLGANGTLAVTVAGTAVAATINVTAVSPAAAGYVTVWPCDAARPTASTLNFGAGDVVANMVTTALGSNRLCVSSSSATDLVVDLVGLWQPAVGANPTVVRNTRLLDTRPVGLVGAGSVTRVTRGALVPARAAAVELDVTASEAAAPGYVTVYACDAPRPATSNLDVVPGRAVSNAVVVNGSGDICLFSLTAIDLRVDLTGYLV